MVFAGSSLNCANLFGMLERNPYTLSLQSVMFGWRTEDCLKEHQEKLYQLAELLLKKETLNYQDVEDLLGKNCMDAGIEPASRAAVEEGDSQPPRC